MCDVGFGLPAVPLFITQMTHRVVLLSLRLGEGPFADGVKRQFRNAIPPFARSQEIACVLCAAAFQLAHVNRPKGLIGSWLTSSSRLKLGQNHRSIVWQNYQSLSLRPIVTLVLVAGSDALRAVSAHGACMSKLRLLLVGLVSLSPTLFAQEQNNAEAYSAVAIGTGGTFGGRTIQFDFRVTRYTSDKEVQKLAQLLAEKGQDDLRRALEKEDVGRINPTGTVGNQIAVARKRRSGSDTIITIVTARNMPFIELYRGGRTTDYPFGFLQVKLNKQGQGIGQIMVAAKIRFDKKKGNYEIESYGNQYIKAGNVRPSR